MTRILLLLGAFVILVFAAWPYYNLYRLDTALGEEAPEALSPFVDLPAIRAQYEGRLGDAVGELLPGTATAQAPLADWLAGKLRGLSTAALEQVVTPAWIQALLRDAATRATDKRPAYLLAGVSYAFFASWDRFRVTLGSGETETRLLFALQGLDWRLIQID